MKVYKRDRSLLELARKSEGGPTTSDEEQPMSLVDWRAGDLMPECSMTGDMISAEMKQKYGGGEDEFMEIYTDGSKREGANAVGAAAVVKRRDAWEENTVSLDGRATIFTAEAVAIAEAIKIFAVRGRNRRLIVYSDSASVLKVLERIKNKNAEIIEKPTRARENRGSGNSL